MLGILKFWIGFREDFNRNAPDSSWAQKTLVKPGFAENFPFQPVQGGDFPENHARKAYMK